MQFQFRTESAYYMGRRKEMGNSAADSTNVYCTMAVIGSRQGLALIVESHLFHKGEQTMICEIGDKMRSVCSKFRCAAPVFAIFAVWLGGTRYAENIISESVILYLLNGCNILIKIFCCITLSATLFILKRLARQ